MKEFLDFLKYLTGSFTGWVILIFAVFAIIGIIMGIYFAITFLIDKIKEFEGSKSLKITTLIINTLIYFLVIYLFLFNKSLNLNGCYNILLKNVNGFSDIGIVFQNIGKIFRTPEMLPEIIIIASIPLTILFTCIVISVEAQDVSWVLGVVFASISALIMFFLIRVHFAGPFVSFSSIFTVYLLINYLLCSGLIFWVGKQCSGSSSGNGSSSSYTTVSGYSYSSDDLIDDIGSGVYTPGNDNYVDPSGM